MILTSRSMIEVFKTNVSNPQQADELVGLLRDLLPGSTINFDLEDCDRVLRVDYEAVDPAHITGILSKRGFECSVMQ